MKARHDTGLKKEVGNRLRTARSHLDLSQKAFSAVSEVPLPTIKDYEAGKRMPGGEAIASFYKAGINTHWLLAGDGPTLIGGEQGDILGSTADPKVVAASRNQYLTSTTDLDNDTYVRIPLYDVRAAAGHGALVEQEEVIDFLIFKREWIHNELNVNPNDLYLIQVDGESMEPTLRPGDVILVNHSDSGANRDGIYVLKMDDALLVKRLQRLPGGVINVSSDNAAYKPFQLKIKGIGNGLAIIGRVVWSGRRM